VKYWSAGHSVGEKDRQQACQQADKYINVERGDGLVAQPEGQVTRWNYHAPGVDHGLVFPLKKKLNFCLHYENKVGYSQLEC
jgi:hypothetical protein